MAEINIANSAGRDAVVAMRSVRSSRQVRWMDAQGRQAQSVRLLKSPIERDAAALQSQCGSLGKVSQAIVEGDPEIDAELIGKYLRETARVYVDPERQIVHKVQEWEIVRESGRLPAGTPAPQAGRRRTSGPESPMRWSGVFINKDEACRKFVFVGKQQLVHVNGLTYDFLYAMAKELESKGSLMLLGAGPKSNQPLVFRRGGSPYRGFLEGRTQGEKYCLLLHYSNLELKAPAAAALSRSHDLYGRFDRPRTSGNQAQRLRHGPCGGAGRSQPATAGAGLPPASGDADDGPGTARHSHARARRAVPRQPQSGRRIHRPASTATARP